MAKYDEILENLLLQEGFGAIWQYNYEVREPGEEGSHADPNMAHDDDREQELMAKSTLAKKPQDFPAGSGMDGVHHPCASKKLMGADVGMPTNSEMDGKHSVPPMHEASNPEVTGKFEDPRDESNYRQALSIHYPQISDKKYRVTQGRLAGQVGYVHPTDQSKGSHLSGPAGHKLFIPVGRHQDSGPIPDAHLQPVDEQMGDMGGMSGTPMNKEESSSGDCPHCDQPKSSKGWDKGQDCHDCGKPTAVCPHCKKGTSLCKGCLADLHDHSKPANLPEAKGKKKSSDAKKEASKAKSKDSGPKTVTQTQQPGQDDQQAGTQSQVQSMMIFRMQSDQDASEASSFFNSIGLATKTDGPILLVDPVQQPMNSMPFSTIQLRLPSPEDAKDAYERLNSLGVQGEVEGNQILVEPQTPEDSALVARVAKIYGLSLTGFRTDAAGSGGMMQQAPGQQPQQ